MPQKEGPYDLAKLKRMWEAETISFEQIIGQLLRHLELIQAEIATLRAESSQANSRLTALEAELREIRQLLESSHRLLERRIAALEAT